MELQTQLKGFPTPISVKQWLFTALVLNLDPQAGNQRNALAGFDFMDRENVGKTAQAISESFTQHLVQRHKVSSANAGIAAHLLLAGKAPQFLLKGLPDTLVYGTPEWVSLHTAVNRIEQLAPGAAAGMTYGQVMALHQIKPLSKAEEKQLLRAQMNPLIDWGVINHVIPKNAGDAYSLEQLQLCNTRLAEQTTQVAQARAYLSDVPVPTRRSLALENLKEKFGEQLPYEQRNLWRQDGEGLGYLASSVEAYEAGQLGDAYKPQNLIERFQASSSAWEAKDARIPIDAMYKKAASLPDVNAQYEAAIEKDFAGRRTHSIVQIKDLLSRIPELASNHLTYGRLEYYSVREPDTSVWQHLQAKTGKKGSHGIIIRSTDSSGNVSDYGVFPDARTVRKLEGLPVPMPIGGTNHSFGKIYDGRPEGAHSLPLDFNAFSSSASPQAGVTSEVIVERITPQTLINGELVNESTVTFGANRETQAPGYFNEAFEQIATTLVDSHFLRKDEFKAINRGHNPLETQPSTSLDRLNFLARMIPGVTSIEDIYQGNYVEAGRDLFFDALGILLPVGVGKLWSVAADAFEGAAVKTTEGLAVAAKDMSADAVAGENRVLSRLQNGDRLPGSAELQTRSDIANGRFNLAGDIKEPVKATAVFNDGKWYAYDTKTMAPYGPALEDFVSDTSSSVEQETFSDGAKALVTEKPLAADAYTVTRTHGFDLINEGKVYRYDTREPGLLRDLESADHYKPLEGFEAFCPAPGIGERVKRGANDTCFTKVVEEVSGELRQELQALEHVRLFPSTPKLLRKDQFVIFERRRWKMVDGEMGPQLHPVPESKPIAYKPKITGTLKNEPEFGFFNAQSSEALERETRVVKLNRISDAVDDKREVRGVIVNGTVGGSTAKYLVIEADTAEFYYARLDGAPGSELTFHKCTPDELSMVTAYRNKFSIRQGVANVPFDADFIALPKLNTAFEDLERSGYLKADIDELKASCKDLTKEQQREVVYRLQRAKAIDKADIALRPNQVSELAKPAEFATWTTEQQNKFYAEQAKDSVNRSMKATGLGPGNQIRSKADLARAEAAGMAIGWLRRTVPHGALNRSDLILKSGAGNCGEMALLSKDIIKKSGGRAYEWAAGDAHAFTVVGGPPVLPPGTPDFSEAAWADAWIVAPGRTLRARPANIRSNLKRSWPNGNATT
ncbi:hypothetical protein LRS56_12915 [Pseudomonas poae]|nr:hypothetical protein LRS56_12915 [Pseudomonas poae]